MSEESKDKLKFLVLMGTDRWLKKSPMSVAYR